MKNNQGDNGNHGSAAPGWRLRAAVIGALAVALAVVIWVRAGDRAESSVRVPTRSGDASTTSADPARDDGALPRLVDLGADKCVPCKAMAPILEKLRADYAGRFDVQFVDVWKQRDKALEFGIRVIPTQIFFAPDGRELIRHEGFFSREDILRTWQEHGFDFGPAGAAREAS